MKSIVRVEKTKREHDEGGGPKIRDYSIPFPCSMTGPSCSPPCVFGRLFRCRRREEARLPRLTVSDPRLQEGSCPEVLERNGLLFRIRVAVGTQLPRPPSGNSGIYNSACEYSIFWQSVSRPLLVSCEWNAPRLPGHMRWC